jgi:ABC-type nitrate/sulfonate/bicarbonate transport system substrate-binding protein
MGGMVHATAITPPLDAQARRDGLNVIYELNDLGLPSIYSAVHTSDAMIRSDPDTVQRFVAAMAESLHVTETQPELTRQVLRKVLELEESDALDSAYEAYARKHANRRLSVPMDAASASIEEARGQGTQVTVRGGEDVATNRFTDDLERTGFLERLWGADLPAR